MTLITKKHVLAAAAAGALAFGASSLSAAPMQSHGAAFNAATSDGVTHVHYKKHKAQHRVMHQRNWNAANAQDPGLLGVPFAAAQGAVGLGAAAVGTGLGIAGDVVGGTAAAVTGYPYYGSYGYAPGAYAYAPGYAYGGGPAWGLSPDIGHSYYNGVGAPASQDNCAVDAGYGRRDYSAAC
jgi:hypothetical protein